MPAEILEKIRNAKNWQKTEALLKRYEIKVRSKGGGSHVQIMGRGGGTLTRLHKGGDKVSYVRNLKKTMMRWWEGLSPRQRKSIEKL